MHKQVQLKCLVVQVFQILLLLTAEQTQHQNEKQSLPVAGQIYGYHLNNATLLGGNKKEQRKKKDQPSEISNLDLNIGT